MSRNKTEELTGAPDADPGTRSSRGPYSIEAIVLDRRDNVAISLVALEVGARVDLRGRSVRIAGPLPAGHKFALEDIPAGAVILKYGEIIGRACRAIGVGQHVHIHNVVSARLPGSRDA